MGKQINGDCDSCWRNQFNRGCVEPVCRYEKRPALDLRSLWHRMPTPEEGRRMYEESLKTEAKEKIKQKQRESK